VNPLVYVIVLTYNHVDVTLTCLESINALTYPNYEIVVVDNGSVDNTPEIVRQEFPELYLLANQYNLGFAGGVNVGIKYALWKNADYILLLNNDTIVTIDLLDKLIAKSKCLPDIGLLGPRITYYNEPAKTWFVGGMKSRFTNELIDLNSKMNVLTFDERIFEVDYLYGTAVLISREVFKKIGLFDEVFFMYNEDLDFCIRAKTAGFKLITVPNAVVKHLIETSSGQNSAFLNYHKTRSNVIFNCKHTHGFRWLFVLPYRFLIVLRKTGKLIYYWRMDLVKANIMGLFSGVKWLFTVKTNTH
jgi:GT2 family glycosyltransferase